jgi:selenocysteine-specific elongation factor
MIVATAGHVDHGKTSLVRALTGIDTDRLPEEKARGISIDIGFAYWNSPRGHTIGFIDVPGHQKFVRNMLCGVCAIDHVILVIAADDGVMPQTREHLSIVDLLGVSDGTVVITKKDRVTAQRINEVAADAHELLMGTALEGAPILPLSAANGDGMEVLRQRLDEVAAARGPAANQDTFMPRFIIDRVFSVPGSGTVVTGTVIAGHFAPNDRAIVSPAGTEVRVRKLQQQGKSVQEVRAGQRCALNLTHIEHTALGRGDWLVSPDAHTSTDRMDVRIGTLAESGPLKHWTALHVHIGTADVLARISTGRGAAIGPGESAWAQLRLDRPVNAARGDRLIIRDQSSTQTLGGGVVVDPLPPLRRSLAQRAFTLAALELTSPTDSLAALLEGSDKGIDLNLFSRVTNLRRNYLQQILPAGTAVFGTERPLAFSAAWIDAVLASTVEWLRQSHKEQPAMTWVESAPLQRHVAPGVNPVVFAALLKRFVAGGSVLQQGTRLRMPEHGVREDPRDSVLWQKVLPVLEQAGADIPSVRELAAQCGVALPIMRDLIYRKSTAGLLVKITLERFALPRTMAMLAGKAHEAAGSCGDGLFTAAQYRDVIGTGRGLAIEILECLDKMGTTRRTGMQRCCVETDSPPAGGATKGRNSK